MESNLHILLSQKQDAQSGTSLNSLIWSGDMGPLLSHQMSELFKNIFM